LVQSAPARGPRTGPRTGGAPSRLRWLAAVVLGLGGAAVASGLPPLALDGGWRVVGLPNQGFPLTTFTATEVDGVPAIRIDAQGSYGNLVHAVDAGRFLAWRWRLDQPLAGADLRTKAGDDAALKVCALYDLPLDALPFWERQKMRIARSAAGEWLPSATLCYVWDPALPAGTVLSNAHSPRLRWIVAQGQGAALAQWQDERRDLHADFLRAFGDEASAVPPLRAVGIGADADNTGGRSRGHVAALALQP
jgi:hypothetical protein